MRFVAHLSPGPAWIEGKSIGEQDRSIIGAHLVSMRRLYDERAVLFGGPYASGFGGIALLEASDLATAAAIMDADPAVVAGLLTHHTVEVRQVFDAFSGQAWSPRTPG